VMPSATRRPGRFVESVDEKVTARA